MKYSTEAWIAALQWEGLTVTEIKILFFKINYLGSYVDYTPVMSGCDLLSRQIMAYENESDSSVWVKGKKKQEHCTDSKRTTKTSWFALKNYKHTNIYKPIIL